MLDMNKIILPIIIAFLILFISVAINLTYQYNNACKDLGYETHASKGGFSFCVDNESNYHYVHITSNPFFVKDIKEISVGDVRVIKNP